jgi:four helix bundle protein
MSGQKLRISSYKELIVWQKGMNIVTLMYRVTRTFPVEERYGLCSQMRRAAVSIPSNIAEGWAKKTKNHFMEFLRTALGSCAELETQVEVGYSEKFLAEADYNEIVSLLTEESKMLTAMIVKMS